MEAHLQPGGAGQAQSLLIMAVWYGAVLSYKVNDAGASARTLDQPRLFNGSGAVSMIDAAAPTKLFFGNATTGPAARDAAVQILVGRDATP